jgi:ABC-type transport system substrate-binding protein
MQGYWDKFSKQRTTRRRVVSGLAGLGVSAAALSLVGCGDDDDSPSGTSGSASSGGPASGSTGASSGASSQGKAVSDKVVISLNYAGVESNDPRDIGGGASWQLTPIYDALTSHDQAKGAMIPGLATEWEASPDGLSISFKIRKGVPFNDGSGELTAEDVLYTYEYGVADPEKGTRLRQRIDRLEKTADDEVVVHLREPDISNYTLFSDMYTWGSIISKADAEKSGAGAGLTKPPLVGTGPWKYLEREPGSVLRFARVEDHWNKTPDFKELEFRIQKENSTRQASLLAGETHITQLPEDLTQAAADGGMKVITANVLSLHFWMQFYGRSLDVTTGQPRHPDSPLHDLRVRKAMNRAINREELLQAFLNPDSEIMSFGVQFRPDYPGWDNSWDTSGQRWKDEYGYNPEDATALLAAAGYSHNDPFKTNMFASTKPIPEGLDIQQTILGMWNAVGIESEFTTIDEATLDARARKFEFVNDLKFDSTQSQPPAVLGFRMNSLRTRAVDPKYTGTPEDVGIPGLAELFDKAISSFDPEQHDSQMKEVGELLFVNHAFIPLFWSPVQFTTNPDVIAGWSMPGVAGGVFSHTAFIEAVKK